ncbi:MAG: Fic family protein [Deltaproteobacteria bacterium]|nr:Fic family protein [Deltaproteobacteria bacterium]
MRLGLGIVLGMTGEDALSETLISQIDALAFNARHKLVAIRPFGDGSGRTARMLMNHVLRPRCLPLAMARPENKKKYMEAPDQTRGADNMGIFRDPARSRQIKYLSGGTGGFQRIIRATRPAPPAGPTGRTKSKKAHKPGNRKHK